MAAAKKQVVTKEYFESLEKEYRHLIDIDRPQVIAEVAEARSQGDLSENADYDAARNKQAEIEARIKDLEYLLNNLEIDNSKGSKNKVTATSTVVLYDTVDECDYTYQLVGSAGGNPLESKITTESSLGAAILGKEVGSEVEVICGDGSSYKVVIKEIK